MSDNIKVFTYGCLSNKRIQSILFGRELKRVYAKLNGWISYVCPEGYLGITPNSTGYVDGYVVTMNKIDIKISDLWEEIPVYKKEYLDVLIGNNKIESVCVYTRRTHVPCGEYLNNKELNIDYVIQEANLFMKKINFVKFN